MTAETIAGALGGRKAGSVWTARCPAHDVLTPSLSISDPVNGKVLVRCHAGCGQQQVIGALRSRGLWGNGSRQFKRLAQRAAAVIQPEHDDARRTEVALSIWQASKLANSTPVETYLASRGLHLPPQSTLRFHAQLKHRSGGTWPAMVALVTLGTDSVPIAVHRTYLCRSGTGKAPVDPPKMMLGPCRGGAVRLGLPGEVLLVGEGIETCLAAMLATGKPAWAALSTSGLRALDLPDTVRDVIVLADGDGPGEAAARDCAWRLKREGRRMRIARPPQGMDFNDVLVGHALRIEEGAR